MSLMIMVGRYLYGYLLLTKGQNDWASMMVSEVRTMMYLPTRYHISVQNGEKIKLIDRAAEAVWETADLFLFEIVPYAVFFTILTVVGFIIDPILTLSALIFLPLIILVVQSLGKKAHSKQREANTYWDRLFGRVGDVFTNIQIIKVSAREEYEGAYIHGLYQDASERQLEIRKYWLVFNSFWRFIRIIPRILVLSVSIYLYAHDSISLGTIFFFFSFTDTIYTPIFNLIQNYQQLMQSFAKYEQLEATVDLPKEKDEWVKEFPWIKSDIRFENVSFIYPWTERAVLRDIDFSIEKWQRVALIGHTGSGKSTITQLLMRFYEPTEGKILVDWINIYDFTLSSYRQKFATVFQDTTLFNESIRHNLEYVRSGITEAELRKASSEANILDFIESLPNKWETEVGERGLKLSGWEKQRIAIARAILSDPEILILDEATSALDTKTERLVQEAFNRLMVWRTSIVIAHRLSTIQNADMIYLLEKGNIIAWGNHRELLATSPLYREMVSLQHDGFLGKDDELENPLLS